MQNLHPDFPSQFLVVAPSWCVVFGVVVGVRKWQLTKVFQGDAFTHILLTLRTSEPRADVFVGLRFLLYNFGLRLAIARGRRLALVISTSFARRNKKG